MGEGGGEKWKREIKYRDATKFSQRLHSILRQNAARFGIPGVQESEPDTHRRESWHFS